MELFVHILHNKFLMCVDIFYETIKKLHNIVKYRYLTSVVPINLSKLNNPPKSYLIQLLSMYIYTI